MCTDTGPSHAVISVPRNRRMPSSRAAASASAHPLVVSWSLIEAPCRPIWRLSSTRDTGVCVPSEYTVWQWMSQPDFGGAAASAKRVMYPS